MGIEVALERMKESLRETNYTRKPKALKVDTCTVCARKITLWLRLLRFFWAYNSSWPKFWDLCCSYKCYKVLSEEVLDEPKSKKIR